MALGSLSIEILGWQKLLGIRGTLVLRVTVIELTQLGKGVLWPMSLVSNTRPRMFMGYASLRFS